MEQRKEFKKKLDNLDEQEDNKTHVLYILHKQKKELIQKFKIDLIRLEKEERKQAKTGKYEDERIKAHNVALTLDKAIYTHKKQIEIVKSLFGLEKNHESLLKNPREKSIIGHLKKDERKLVTVLYKQIKFTEKVEEELKEYSISIAQSRPQHSRVGKIIHMVDGDSMAYLLRNGLLDLFNSEEIILDKMLREEKVLKKMDDVLTT